MNDSASKSMRPDSSPTSMRVEFHFTLGVIAIIVTAVVAPILTPFVVIGTFLSAPVTFIAERVAESWTPVHRTEDQ